MLVGPAYVNHDAAWYLHVVQRWLAGATLYRDVIDTNPPLIIWLSTPAVWLAGLSGWPAPALFKVSVLAVAAVSLLIVRAIVRRGWPGREFLLVALSVFVALPFAKGDFGQREHFAVLLTMPYVFAAVSQRPLESRPLRWLIGAAAGLGFAIKPHFLTAWLALEVVVFLAKGRPFGSRGRELAQGGSFGSRVRPELVAALAACAAYALVVILATPDYVGMVSQVRQVYGGLDSPFSVLVRLREVQLWLAAAALFAAIRWPRSDRLPTVLFAVGTGYLVSALLQFKGWGYQLYPARVFIILFLASAVATLLDELPGAAGLLRGGRRGLAVVFAAALVVAAVRYVVEARRPAAPDLVAPLLAAIAAHAPQGPLTVLSMRTIIYPAFPAVNYSGAAWGLRHNSLWFLPGLYSEHESTSGGPIEPRPPDRMSPLERSFFDQIIDDLCASPPQLLAIERAAPAAPAGRRALDLQAYYSQSPRAKPLLDVYQPRASLGPFTLLTPSAAARCH
jgi:hypothetical protein